MDPGTLLDHALFHLTPTRTRCDLLVVPAAAHSKGGGSPKEKIASGLVEPFLAHLRSARDQIPKGGYSFTLRPPAGVAPWFTKGTVERFVRFVATPEILERVVTIEREIVQIEESISREDHFSTPGGSAPPDRGVIVNSSLASNGNTKKSSKLNDEADNHDAAQGENSKICLLRVLENRTTMLQKEQGMAYARASVAGFDKGHIDELISFADAFGASRLREACINFQELCNEKEKDKLWMDELAALEACRQSQVLCVGDSGIMLTSDANAVTDGQQESVVADGEAARNSVAGGSSLNAQGMGSMPWNQGNDGSNGRHHFPMGWPNHPPEYMYNFQGHGVPNSAPFHGYPYPGMPFVPPYPGYPENSYWPPRNEEKDTDGSHYRGTSRKIRRSADATLSSKDASSDHESSNSESEEAEGVEHDISTDVDSSKKGQRRNRSKKKSSRTVVIRNINYISSKGRHEEDDGSDKSSDEEEFTDGDFLRRQVEDIVGSFEKHQHPTRHHNKNRSEKKSPGGANGLPENDDKSIENDAAKKYNDKSDDGWGAFQNILMKDETQSDELSRNRQQVDVADEYCMIKNGDTPPSAASNYQLDKELGRGIKPKVATDDPIIGAERGTTSGGNGSLEKFEYDDNYYHNIKRSHNADEEMMFSARGKPVIGTHEAHPAFIEEPSSLKGQREGDWFIISGSEKRVDRDIPIDSLIFGGNQILKSNDDRIDKDKRQDIVADDSFIAHVREPMVEEQPFSLWKTDMSVISGLANASGPQNTTSSHSKENGQSGFHEPDELQLVLERRHSEVEDTRASWTPELDYTADISYTSSIQKKTSGETNDPVSDKLPTNAKAVKGKTEGHPKSRSLGRSLTKNKLEALSRPRTMSTLSKKASNMSKAEREEAERRRIEEQLLERQKRIAQRSSSSTTPMASKQTKVETKKISQSKTLASQSIKQNGFGHVTKLPQPKHIASRG